MNNYDKDDCGCKKSDDCDCCCVEGIKDQLRDARKREVLIRLKSGDTVRGEVKKVNCDVVVLKDVTSPVTGFSVDYAVVSLCEIAAFFVRRQLL